MDDIKKDPFEEYIKNLPPSRKELGQAWSAAVGLQDVDGLKPSDYLYSTAKKNIDGEITIDEAGELINSYYESKQGRTEHSTEEADKVSQRIAKLLSDKSFVFSPAQYISIHRELFIGIYSHAGKLRDYNFTKKEWVLDGDTVLYGRANNLKETLEYDFSQERDFSYNGMTMPDVINHLAKFISRLWQIHVFGEGNTRTTAVFFIKYLRQLGLMQTMTCLPGIRGTLEIHWLGLITTTSKRRYMKPRNIWKNSSVIFFLMKRTNFIIEQCMFVECLL